MTSRDALAERLRERSLGTRRSSRRLLPRGDHDLNPDLYCPDAEARQAAVLVPLVARGREEPNVLFTRRSARLANHAGQIAFPGGCAEPGDPDEVATALRETEEEIGIGPDLIQPLGRLDLYVTRTGFAVTPIVGWIDQAPEVKELVLDAREVDEAFEVPLSFFLDRGNRQRHARRHEGIIREFYAYPYGNYYIWGATAGMLSNLVEVLGSLDQKS